MRDGGGGRGGGGVSVVLATCSWSSHMGRTNFWSNRRICSEVPAKAYWFTCSSFELKIVYISCNLHYLLTVPAIWLNFVFILTLLICTLFNCVTHPCEYKSSSYEHILNNTPAREHAFTKASESQRLHCGLREWPPKTKLLPLQPLQWFAVFINLFYNIL